MGIFVITKSDKLCMSQMIGTAPLQEVDLGFFRGRTEFPLMSVACITASQNAPVLLAYRCSRSIEGSLRLRRQARVTDHPLGFEGQGPGAVGPDHER